VSRIAYLSMDSLADFECYDELTVEPLARLGHRVDEVSWRTPAPWDDYDAVIIRSCWDYQKDADAFLACLEAIERSSATLLNPLAIVRWNINKRYLLDLEQRGVAIVPTHFRAGVDAAALQAAYRDHGTDELIVKPAVSAGADDTFRVQRGDEAAFVAAHSARFAQRECLLQPFLPAIITEGEYSLFYFAGVLSHCILKTPRSEDFRVQEEHGGQLQLIAAPEPELLNAGERTLAAIAGELLYARLDYVREGDRFLLMEAELIEPSLYFNLDAGSAERFALSVDSWLYGGRTGRIAPGG
jgi:glutathione synthase/RimK-type ligase-like ATP-grasp enzyme